MFFGVSSSSRQVLYVWIACCRVYVVGRQSGLHGILLVSGRFCGMYCAGLM